METTTDIFERNLLLKTLPLENMDFINYQQILFRANGTSDNENSSSDSPKKENVCYETISESKRKLKFKRIKKVIQR